MSGLLRKPLAILSSYGLAVGVILWLFLLTLFGTLEHCNTELSLFAAQEKYFDSFFFTGFYVTLPFIEPFRLNAPLPGAQLAMLVLFVNLIVGGMVRLKLGKRTLGIFITHIGIAVMLVAGFVKYYHADDGHLSLYPGQRAAEFESYYHWQISITRQLDDGKIRESVIEDEDFSDMSPSESRTFKRDELPFDLVVTNYLPNCEPRPKGPMFEVTVPVVDGFFLRQLPRELDAEFDVAGAYVTLLEKKTGERHEGILWGSTYSPNKAASTAERNPLVFDIDGVPWGVELLHERYPLPYAIHLQEFIHELHPRTSQPRNFQSDVLKIDSFGEQPVAIRMNEPLRDQGHILFQSGYGPGNAKPGTEVYTVLSVSRNPSDHWPLISCAIIAIGLLIHFLTKLTRYVDRAAEAS